MSRKPPLPEAASTVPSVQKTVLDALDAARRALQSPGKRHATRIHDFRKALKRLRALLRLMTPVLGAEAGAIRIEVRDLARELGATRDAQSAIDAARDLRKGRWNHELSEQSMQSIAATLEQLKRSGQRAKLSAETRLRLLTWVDSLDARVRMWPEHSPEYPALAAGLKKAYRRARRAVPENWTAAGDDTLHELRQRVIIHRNQLDLIEPLHSRLVGKWINAAQQIRGRLGRHHDLTLLTRLSEPGQPLARWRPGLRNDIGKRQRDHLDAAERSARRFFDASPRSFGKRLEELGKAGG